MFIFIIDRNWIEIIQAASAVLLVIIAAIALGTWKSQFRAQRRIAFIDALTDTVHGFILAISPAITAVGMARLGIEAYRSAPKIPGEDEESPEITFIKKRGPATAKIIQENLDPVLPLLQRMQSLAVKGETYDLKNYTRCRSACSALEDVYRQVAAYAGMMGNGGLNWDNPEVQRILSITLSVTDTELFQALADQNGNYLEFAKEAYEGL